MKKSVVILIAIIYVAAIALVSFFGLQFKVFEQIVPVEKIEILNTGLKENELFGKYAVVTLDENNEAKYLIECRVYPDDATNKEISFAYDLQTKNVTVDEKGLVTFSGISTVTITIAPRDGSDTSAKITIIAVKGK